MAVGASVLVLAACASDGSGDGAPGAGVGASGAEGPVSDGTGETSGDDTSADEDAPGQGGGSADEDPPALDGPAAPDFTLALADGSEFVLSAEQRATFLIFWAEW